MKDMNENSTADNTARLTGLLRDHGLRPTRQRMALASLLIDTAARHVTADQMRREIAELGITMSLATIYNTLNQFTRVGLLREINPDGEVAYFDTNTERHHHFYDQTTGKLTDIPANSINISSLPNPPAGKRIERVDVFIRLSGDS